MTRIRSRLILLLSLLAIAAGGETAPAAGAVAEGIAGPRDPHAAAVALPGSGLAIVVTLDPGVGGGEPPQAARPGVRPTGLRSPAPDAVEPRYRGPSPVRPLAERLPYDATAPPAGA